MSTQILIKRSTTTGAIPTAQDIAVGELAINTVDKRIFTNNSGTIVELGTTPTTQAVTGNASVGGTFDVVGAVTVGNFSADGTVDLTSATVTIPAPTADTHPATKKYVDDEVNAILDGAPAALDTLNEIAAAINDDANAFTTLTNSIATKLPLAGGTMTGAIDMGVNGITTSVDPATDNTLTRKSYVDGLYQSTVDAEDSATAAAASATAAATSATSAASSASTATTQASNASTSATNAATSATNAGNSATSSANSATASATSATQSASSASAAATSETNAATSATNAATSETNAASSETAAAASETAALASQVAAASSETNAAASETASASSETNAAASETNAAASETAAATSAANAATSATNSETSYQNTLGIFGDATDVASAVSSAASSATAASAAKDAALAALDSFDDRYLGEKTADPSVDNDGNALVSGALYFNSTDENMKVYSGTQWLNAYSDISGALIATANLSDLSNVASARTNLGLGTAATTASTDYATAAQGALADSAIQASGDSMTGDLAFGDNDKAVFGAGSDLQIYHDTFNSVIKDAGTGNLKILAQNLRINNATDTAGMLTADVGGAVTAYHNGSPKLATTSTGVDVTGTVTADGLTVSNNDSSKLVFNATDTSLVADQTIGEIQFYANDASTNATGNKAWIKGKSEAAGGDEVGLSFATSNGVSSTGIPRLNISATGDISFYEDTGTTAKFFWDASAESLGIGTSSPSADLHVSSSSGTIVKVFDTSASATGPIIRLGTEDTSRLAGDSIGKIDFYASDASLPGPGVRCAIEAIAEDDYNRNALLFSTANYNDSVTERMRIDSSGNVGIGTSSPIYPLDVAAPSNIYARFASSAVSAEFGITSPTPNVINLGAGSGDALSFSSNSTEAMRIDSSGNLLVGTTSTAALDSIKGVVVAHSGSVGYAMADSTGRDYLLYTTNGNFEIWDSTANAARMRIDSAGNLFAGKTASDTNAVGHELKPQGVAVHTADSITPLYLNRKTSDGDIAIFRKDNTTVGSIGVKTGSSSYLTIGNVDTGVLFNGNDNTIEPWNVSTNSGSNGAINLGASAARFKDLYLSGNIAVSGTVDGRDIAADGSTLDGLQTALAGKADSSDLNFTLLETWTPTAVASKIFTWDESIYAGVRLVVCGVACSVEGSPLRATMGWSNGASFGGGQYEYAYVYDYNGSMSNTNEATNIPLAGTIGTESGSNNGLNGIIDVFTPQTNDAGFSDFGIVSNLISTNFSSLVNQKTTAMLGPYAGGSTTTATYDSIKLYLSGANFAAGVGEIYVYGYKR